MLKTSNRKKFYIVNKITFQLNEYVLTADTIRKMIVLSTLIDLISEDEKMIVDSFSSNSFSLRIIDINLDLSNRTSKLKMYKFWHKRFVHLKSIKFRNFHQMITLKKFISIVENQNSCEIYILIKMINKRNHQCSKKKFKF